MGYLDEDRTVTLKGRVACEIATGDELVGTEIIFAGVLADIPPEEAVALLAALVFQEKNASPPELGGSLQDACERAKVRWRCRVFVPLRVSRRPSLVLLMSLVLPTTDRVRREGTSSLSLEKKPFSDGFGENKTKEMNFFACAVGDA